MSFLGSLQTTDMLRRNNRAKILHALRANGGISHTELMHATSLASGTVSGITSELIDENIIEKMDDFGTHGRGRPRVIFQFNSYFTYIVLIRIYAAHIEHSLLDYQGKLIDRVTIARDQYHKQPAKFEESFRLNFNNFLSRSKIENASVSMVSITSKGEVDPASKAIIWSPIFGDSLIDFKRILGEEWKDRISLNHELCYVAHNLLQQSMKNKPIPAEHKIAVISLTDSVSLGIASADIYGEITLSAPPFGHMVHDIQGPRCRCGANGCLESIVGFYGILRAAYDGPVDKAPGQFIPLKQMQILADVARKGDRKIAHAFTLAGQALGLATSRMFSITGPMPLTIVGTGLSFFDLMKDAFQAQLSKGFSAKLFKAQNIQFIESEGDLGYNSNAYQSLHQVDQDLMEHGGYFQKVQK